MSTSKPCQEHEAIICQIAGCISFAAALLERVGCMKTAVAMHYATLQLKYEVAGTGIFLPEEVNTSD